MTLPGYPVTSWEEKSVQFSSAISVQNTPAVNTPNIVRAPLSLLRIHWDEQQDTITWSAFPSGFFKCRVRRYPDPVIIEGYRPGLGLGVIHQLMSGRKRLE